MFKSIFKVTTGLIIIAGAGLGGTFLIAGPQRTHAVLGQVHSNLLQAIDENVDDPSALRSQLKGLDSDYAGRIGQVRNDLGELRIQMRQLQKDQAICERVVAMAEADLTSLEPVMTQASSIRASNGASSVRVVSWDDKVYSYDRASNQLNQVRQTVTAYTNRAADAKHDLLYLGQQEARLDELLGTLEMERTQFQSQISQLNRQVDAIARNERLIDLLEDRNKTIDECSKYDAVSLDNLTARLADVRNRQQAELDLLANNQHQLDYEDLARMQVRQNGPATQETLMLPLPEVTAGK